LAFSESTKGVAVATVSRRTFLGVGSAVSLALLNYRGSGQASTLESGRGLLSERAETAARVQETTQQVVIAIGPDPLTLDPRRTEVSEALSLTHVINEETLFRDVEGAVIPYLAESWEYTDDITLVLHLKEGLQFSNGEPFDAAAVKYTIESVMDPANAWVAAEKRGWFSVVDQIDAPDAATVAITLKEPNRVLLSYLTLLGIVPPELAQAEGENYGNAPAGTGPYDLAAYIPGDHLELSAREDYWGSAAKNEIVIVRFIKEDATRVAALEAGEVQVISNVPTDVLGRIEENDELEVVAVDGVRTVFVTFMTQRPPFDNLDLRKAVFHAIDRQAIVDSILSGYGEVAQSVYAPGVAHFAPQTPYEYDPEKATALIAESGFDTNQVLKFASPTGQTVNDRAVAEAVTGMLNAVGLQVELDTPEWGTFLDNSQRSLIYDFYIASMAPDNLDPDYALFPWFRSDISFIKYSNSEVDDLLTRGAAATDLAEQEEIYTELQTFLWEDLPYAPLYVVPQIWAKTKNLTGFELRADGIFLFKDAAIS
jgi:peptide/nickel transport system substrate-binding protein